MVDNKLQKLQQQLMKDSLNIPNYIETTLKTLTIQKKDILLIVGK